MSESGKITEDVAALRAVVDRQGQQIRDGLELLGRWKRAFRILRDETGNVLEEFLVRLREPIKGALDELGSMKLQLLGDLDEIQEVLDNADQCVTSRSFIESYVDDCETAIQHALDVIDGADFELSELE
jgi:hypothetical protein